MKNKYLELVNTQLFVDVDHKIVGELQLVDEMFCYQDQEGFPNCSKNIWEILTRMIELDEVSQLTKQVFARIIVETVTDMKLVVEEDWRWSFENDEDETYDKELEFINTDGSDFGVRYTSEEEGNIIPSDWLDVIKTVIDVLEGIEV